MSLAEAGRDPPLREGGGEEGRGFGGWGNYVPAEPPRPPVGLHRSPDEVQRCFCFLHSVALVTHADALLPALYIGSYSSVWEVGWG